MNICNKCLENNWKFEYNDGWVTATCQNCGHYVEFAAKDKIKAKPGDTCRKCKKGIIFKKESKFNPKKLKRPYYFTAYYFCPVCRTMYMAEEFKVINKNYKAPLPTISENQGRPTILDLIINEKKLC